LLLAGGSHTYIFVEDRGGGALEEVTETIAEPPLSSLMLVIGAFFEPDELRIRELGGSCRRTAFEEPELCIIGFNFSKVAAAVPGLAG
jgi:hypothetical protein